MNAKEWADKLWNDLAYIAPEAEDLQRAKIRACLNAAMADAETAAHEAGKVEGIEASAKACDRFASGHHFAGDLKGEKSFRRCIETIRALLPAAEVEPKPEEGSEIDCGDCEKRTKARTRGHRVTCAVCGWYDVMPEVASRIMETSAPADSAEVAAASEGGEDIRMYTVPMLPVNEYDEKLVDALLNRAARGREMARKLTTPPVAATTAVEGKDRTAALEKFVADFVEYRFFCSDTPCREKLDAMLNKLEDEAMRLWEKASPPSVARESEAQKAWRALTDEQRDEVCGDISAEGVSSHGDDAVAHHAALAVLRAFSPTEPRT